MELNTKIAGVLLCDSKTKYGIYKDKIIYLCKPHDPSYPDFYVPSKYENEIHKKYVYIQYVGEFADKPMGQVIEYIGNVGNKDAEYLYLRYVCNIHHIKELKVQKEKLARDEKLHASIQKAQAKYQIFTIDPIGCEDIDDGFHFRMCEDGCYEVGVHISYVWKYFEKDATYYEQFMERVSTLYMEKKNIDMIPKEYSRNLGSLREKQNKYALSIIYTIHPDGRVLDQKIGVEVVYVMKNYDYDSVDAILGKEPTSKKEEMLHRFFDLSRSFFKKSVISDSHEWVEQWMIFANSTMARACVEQFGDRVILRVQPRPQTESQKPLTEMDERLAKFMSVYESSAALYQFYNPVDSMANEHASLRVDCYTHYTSPIRRFCDMYIHGLYTGTLPHEAPLPKIDWMNEMNRRFRKYQNRSKVIDLVFQHVDKEEYEITTSGYIIDRSNCMVKVYFPDYEFVLKKVCQEEEENTLYEKRDCTLYLFPKKYMLHERIRMKII